MHTLTLKRMTKFSRDFGFTLSESELFERYISATYLYRYLKNDPQLIESTVLGGGDDQGIDIAAVIVNNQLVTEPGNIDELLSGQGYDAAKVIFIQTKTSESYDSKLVAKFLHGIESVTKRAINSQSIDLPPRLVDVALLIERITENMASFVHKQIPCEILYVTTSSNNGHSVRNELQVTEALNRINELKVFESNLTLHTHGHEEIAAKEKERLGPLNISFTFEKRLTIPAAEEVEEAYVGLLPVNEVLKLLKDENGIRPGIFEDNVRLDLGVTNPVNQRIFDSLNSDRRTQFPLLNNGLTIIASKLQGTGDKFLISGYQIVNGGQTSHQLLRWAASEDVVRHPELLTEVRIPVKIVSSADREVRSRVAVATNLQTAIENVDIQSSSQIAKDVEEYFEDSGAEGLRYERQGRGKPLQFPKTRVVKTGDLNRCVASAVFGASTTAIASPKDLDTEDSFVWGNYPVEAYFYSAWIVYRIDRYFANVADKSCLKAAKYHIAMIVSAMVNPRLIENFESDNKNPKKLSKQGNFTVRIGKGKLYKDIEGAIPVAAEIVSSVFSDVLKSGRSLRKDDVRAQRHQTELLQETKARLKAI